MTGMKFWLAKSKGGELTLHRTKPIYHDGYGWTSVCTILNSQEFPDVTFENSPQEAKLRLVSENISESIVNEFMNTLNFTYDKSEKCMVAKVYNADLTSLTNIIDSKL